MSGKIGNPQEEREKYVNAFNSTMIKIWKEKVVLLGAISTGALYRSIVGIGVQADGKYISVTLSQSFNAYGLFVDAGTGKEVYRGNPGDIGREKKRQPKPWFRMKYYSSAMNIQEFYADNLGKEGALMISNALDTEALRKSVWP